MELEWCIYESVNWTKISSDNDLSPDECYAIIWTNTGTLYTGPLGIHFREICNEITTYLKIIGLKMQSIHYSDVIMTTIASQITSLTVVYSTVYSDADQRKHQSSTSLAFVWGIHRDRWIPRTKDQLRGKCAHLMMSSWKMCPFWLGLCVLIYHTLDGVPCHFSVILICSSIPWNI